MVSEIRIFASNAHASAHNDRHLLCCTVAYRQTRPNFGLQRQIGLDIANNSCGVTL